MEKQPLKSKYIFAIESSCDDSSIAILRHKDKQIIECLSISSSSLQNKFGGVVPELAAREHAKSLISLTQEILLKTQISWDEIDWIAYTEQPGLINCLLVGKVFAQTLSFIFNKQLIPINHVYAHIFSIGLTEELTFPFLALVASGKTTSIFQVKSANSIVLLDSTKDNALGEAYDKVARKMGLPYPGGKEIDKLFNPNLSLPPLLKNQLSPKKPFSYSGLITASYLMWDKIVENKNITNKQAYLSHVFQKFVLEHLMSKMIFWCKTKDINFFLISGGVANNKYLKELSNKQNPTDIKIKIVDKKYASDNAAMIAYFASWII